MPFVTDALTGQQALLARARAARPGATGARRSAPRFCPFCPGPHADAEVELDRIAGPDGGWVSRSVPNPFPLVDPDGAPNACGHEVVVVSPDHVRHLDTLDPAVVAAFVRLLAGRLAKHRAGEAAATVAWVNAGIRAGASQPHPHAQVVTLDRVPPVLAAEAARLARPACVLCDGDGDGLTVVERDGFVARCPQAPTAPFEATVAPCRHRAHLDSEPDEALDGFAGVLADLVRRVRRVTGGADWNLVLHTGPARPDVDFHWHAHLYPRHVPPAGFELATGFAVAEMTAHECARQLRHADDDGDGDPGGPTGATGPAVIDLTALDRRAERAAGQASG